MNEDRRRRAPRSLSPDPSGEGDNATHPGGARLRIQEFLRRTPPPLLYFSTFLLFHRRSSGRGGV